MDAPAIITVVVLVATVALFVSDRFPLDLVSLVSVSALMLGGVLTPDEGLSGFSNPVVLLIAGLFVVGAGLQASGLTGWLGELLTRLGGDTERRLIVVIMVTSAVGSSFMSSTGTVAILMPVVVAIARRVGVSPSRLLMPLAFSSLLGGMLTLIGTPPNIVVADELRRHGTATFHFFSFTAPGAVLAVAGIGFMATLGRRLLPAGKVDTEAGMRPITALELARAYGLDDDVRFARVTASSALADRSLRDAKLRSDHGVTVLGIRRRGEDGGMVAVRALPDEVFRVGDELRFLRHEATNWDATMTALGLDEAEDHGELMIPPEDMLAELVLPRRSRIVGRTLKELAFRTRHRSTVLALRRGGQTLEGDLSEVMLQPGDALLVKGATKYLQLLSDAPRDYVVIAQTQSEGRASLSLRKALVVGVITVAMLGAMTFQLVPNVLAVLLAAIALVGARVLTTVEAYRRINWESVIVVAAILPMSTALEKTGLVALVVDGLTVGLGGAGPRAVLATLFVVTAVASQVISNTATTVLVAPVAYQVATALELKPQPFLMAVALAASTAFATPVASPVNMLVLNAGGYRFVDFVRVGVPLQLTLFVLVMLILPLLFPF